MLIRSRTIICCLFLLSVFAPQSGFCLTGQEIAKRMDAVDTSSCGEMQSIMVIRRGSQQLVRAMEVKKKKFGDVEKQLIRFSEPLEVRDTSYLTWSYKDIDKEDDMWIYMPSESLVRRVSGGGKKGPFMRSDYANEDVSKREVADDTHVLLREEELFGVDCYVVEMTPVHPHKTNFSKRIVWVRKDIWLPAKIEFINHAGKSYKELISGGYKKIQGIWTITRQKMSTPSRGTVTIMENRNVAYDIGLSDSLFLQTDMKR